MRSIKGETWTDCPWCKFEGTLRWRRDKNHRPHSFCIRCQSRSFHESPISTLAIRADRIVKGELKNNGIIDYTDWLWSHGGEPTWNEIFNIKKVNKEVKKMNKEVKNARRTERH